MDGDGKLGWKDIHNIVNRITNNSLSYDDIRKIREQVNVVYFFSMLII